MRTGLRAACLLLATSLPAHADTLTAESQPGTPGQALTFPLTFTTGGDVVGVQFEILYAPDKVRIDNPQLSATTNHVVTSRDFGRFRRVVVHSPSNRTLTGGNFLEIPVSVLAGGGREVNLGIRNVMLVRANGSVVNVAVNYNRNLESWREHHFTAAERNNPAISGETADPDQDVFNNLWEYFTASDPRAGLRPRAPGAVAAAASGGGTEVSLLFDQAREAPGVEASFEKSQDLKIWAPATVTLTPTGQEDEATVQMKATLDEAGGDRLFLRMTLRRAP